MIWKKPNELKFTDLCIYIDQNIENIGEERATPEVQDKVYNYLWLLVKALAIKKRMFNNFDDYDGYSFYAATRLYLAIKRNYQNQGKVIKGKLIRPIKSCLNYTKTLLYPMKIEYQNEVFAEVLSEEAMCKKFDTFTYKSKLKNGILSSQAGPTFRREVQNVFATCIKIVEDVLQNCPFRKESADYKHLKISILINIYNNIKSRKRLDFEPNSIVVWRLPKSMQGYVKVLVKEFCIKLKKEITECGDSNQFNDAVLESLLKNPRDITVDNSND